MKVKTNQIMKQFMEDYEVVSKAAESDVVSGLRELLESKLVSIEGCYFLESLLPEGFNISMALRNSFDRTEVECDVNCVHVDDRLDKAVDDGDLLVQGYIYSLLLSKRLEEIGNFVVALNYGKQELTMCTVRFYFSRPNEKGWLSSDLEGYKTEGVLAIVT